MHHGLVTVGDEKMSKSHVNSVLIADLTTRWRPVEVRYYLGSAHYRSTLDFSAGALAAAAAAYRRIEQFTKRARQTLGDEATGFTPEGSLPDAFATAMDQDLGVPAALGVIQSTVRRGNVASDLGDGSMLRKALNDTVGMAHVLGISPDQWATTRADDLGPVLDALVRIALAQRSAARARKDFAAADAIRRQLAEVGITIQDAEGGSRWELNTAADA